MKTAAIIACLFFLTACRRDEITVRRLPKEATPVLSMTAPAGQGAAAPSAGHREVDWTVPAGWQEQPASGMRAGSFSVPSDAGPVDVSVVPLSGDAGGDLANVNRWRGQLALPPVDASGLAKIATRQRLGTHDALVVEFSSEGADARRLIAAIVVRGETSWFFKAVGPDAPTTRLKPELLRFVGGANFHNHD